MSLTCGGSGTRPTVACIGVWRAAWRRRLLGGSRWPLGLAALAVVAGCSEDGSRSGSPGMTEPSPRTATVSKADQGGRLARHHGKVIQTRLDGQPLVFRVTGAPPPTTHDHTPQLAYTLIFRLNTSDAWERRYSEDAIGRYGGFELAGFPVDVFPFGPRAQNCFAANARRSTSQFGSAAMRRLDNTAIGRPVPVKIAPRVRFEDGHTGDPVRRYVRHPRLQIAPFRFKGSAAQARLKSIGCTGLTYYR
jgi:hypothetical protein